MNLKGGLNRSILHNFCHDGIGIASKETSNLIPLRCLILDVILIRANTRSQAFGGLVLVSRVGETAVRDNTSFLQKVPGEWKTPSATSIVNSIARDHIFWTEHCIDFSFRGDGKPIREDLCGSESPTASAALLIHYGMNPASPEFTRVKICGKTVNHVFLHVYAKIGQHGIFSVQIYTQGLNTVFISRHPFKTRVCLRLPREGRVGINRVHKCWVANERRLVQDGQNIVRLISHYHRRRRGRDIEGRGGIRERQREACQDS
mmetsp:Transcript_7854/g.12569  ORF Transcript_7854/g.12569 Transcript_7854/m.12569 type:complete len:261 (+) Transcript_7854:659-1441(+)